MFTPQNGILRFHMCKMVLSPHQNEILRFHVCKNGILMVFFPTPKWYFEVPHVQNGILCSCVSIPAKGTYLKFYTTYLKISTQVLSHAVPHWLAPYRTPPPCTQAARGGIGSNRTDCSIVCSQYLRVDAQCSHHVNGILHLEGQFVPQLQ